MEQEVLAPVVRDERQTAVVATAPATPADIVLYAMKNGGSIAEIREFMELQREWEADQARKAYVADMAEFKKNPPTIYKDKHVSFKTQSGRTEYDHATIGNVVGKIVSALAQHGFSHGWKTEQSEGRVTVICTITHRLGHSESVMLESGADASGGKNSIQAIISAQTYLQRHTLLAATGLATNDQPDDDGEGFTVLEAWIEQANAARTMNELSNVWNRGIDDIGDDKEAYEAFKSAVNARKAQLEAGTTAGNQQGRRPSRMSEIIGNAQQKMTGNQPASE